MKIAFFGALLKDFTSITLAQTPSPSVASQDPSFIPTLSGIVLCVTLIIVLCIVRSRRQKKLVDNKGFSEIAWFIAGNYLTISLIIKAVSQPSLYQLIGAEGLLSLIIGAGAQLVASLSSEIQQDFGYLYQKITSRKRSP